MGRGLGPIQKSLLQYFNELPEGGGLYYSGGKSDFLLDDFKAEHWPEAYGKDAPDWEITYSKYGYGTSYWDRKSNRYWEPEEVERHRAIQNKARVTIHQAIKSLLKRGLLREETESKEVWYSLSPRKTVKLFITDTGRDLITNVLPTGRTLTNNIKHGYRIVKD